jgi:hypothetical protein
MDALSGSSSSFSFQPQASIGEIHTGRVFMLNPKYLPLSKDVEILKLTNVNPLGGNSPHYFLCIGLDVESSYWCPLSSKQKSQGSNDQGVIPNRVKNGFPHFLKYDSWYDTGQIWKIKNDLVKKNAETEKCNFETTDGNKNAVAPIVVTVLFDQVIRALGVGTLATETQCKKVLEFLKNK